MGEDLFKSIYEQAPAPSPSDAGPINDDLYAAVYLQGGQDGGPIDMGPISAGLIEAVYEQHKAPPAKDTGPIPEHLVTALYRQHKIDE
ncbi:MAG: hypothetical protein PHS14_19495 [Elusimicrobia bacterium]|nr:hypothetical protein [Elusimicrobiota bacterium]